MAKSLELEVANFVCRFGGNHVMNDLLEEVVVPAFFCGETRDYRETTYFFLNPEFIYLEDANIDTLALVCRFVKDTVLRRHQVYDAKKGVVPDERAMKSAPSALAILLLKSHRLLYIREVPGAPSAKSFGSTFKHFLRDATFAYQNSVYEQRRDAEEKVTKKAVRELFPVPDVDVVPLVASESLKQFLGRFDKLKTLKIELAPTNNEIDNSGFLKKLRSVSGGTGSKKTVVVQQNNEGLDTKGCQKYAEAAKQGNAFVEMIGVDKNGDDLRGTNENFSVRAQLPTVVEDRDARVKESVTKYSELLDKNIIEIGESGEDYADKLKTVHQKFHGEGAGDGE